MIKLTYRCSVDIRFPQNQPEKQVSSDVYQAKEIQFYDQVYRDEEVQGLRCLHDWWP